MRDQAFRFILEDPHTDPSRNLQKKRARLVTACDSCRAKKIKCIVSAELSGEANKCDACSQASALCQFSDRDRYHAERGVSMPENSTIPPSPTVVNSHDSHVHKRNKRRRSSPLAPSTSTFDPTPDGNTHAAKSSTSRGLLESEGSDSLTRPHASGSLKRIIVPFFRYFGPTANTPGYRRVKVRTLTLPDDETTTVSSKGSTKPPSSGNCNSRLFSEVPAVGSTRSSAYIFSNQVHTGTMGFDPYMSADGPQTSSASDDAKAVNNITTHLFDPARPRYPNPEYLPHLSTLFFEHLACHFPFLDRVDVVRRAEEGSLPAILANCIAALAVRFSDKEELLVGPRQSAGEAFCAMAKLLIVHMLSWPSMEVLQALVLIAWSEFGSGRDSGLWMYSRMAVAMAIDLGLGFEATVQLAATDAEREKVRLTWWAAILIDRINSWGTGRPIAIADNQFDTAFPACDVSAGEDLSRPPPASFVYGYLCRLVQLRGKMGDVLNNLVKRKLSEYPVDMELSELQSQMVSFYHSLPRSLVFTIQNFRRFSKHKQASSFLLLHVMFHSVITTLHRPSLLRRFTPDVALPLASNIELSRSSARSIVDMIMLANEVDQEALLANPFLDLPILTAGRAFLAERETLTKPPPFMSSVVVALHLQSESGLERCKEVLDKMSHFWGGVGCVKRILDQQSSGHLDFDVGEGIQPDSRMTQLRDVELMKQWATSAWRRQRPHGSSEAPKTKSMTSSSPLRTASTIPLLAVDHNSAQYGTTAGNAHATPVSESALTESPEGAAISITGFLDGPLVFGTPANDPRSISTSGSRTEALRISFNKAEADLSFPDLSNELFSIPEGFEEFLASHTDTFASGGNAVGHPGRDQMPRSEDQTGMNVSSNSLGGVFGSGDGDGGGGGGGDGHDLFFPAFSSLGLPMQQIS